MRIKTLSSLIPQKDDNMNMDEKTRDTFYKYIHQKKMDNFIDTKNSKGANKELDKK